MALVTIEAVKLGDTAMRAKDLTLPIIVIVLLYIAYGSLIPGPIGHYAQAFRTGADNFFASLFSGFQTYNPYDRTERAVQEVQK
jgi:hypothetical protein